MPTFCSDYNASSDYTMKIFLAVTDNVTMDINAWIDRFKAHALQSSYGILDNFNFNNIMYFPEAEGKDLTRAIRLYNWAKDKGYDFDVFFFVSGNEPDYGLSLGKMDIEISEIHNWIVKHVL